MADQGSQSAGSGSSMNWGNQSPDQLVIHAKQIFGAIGKLDTTERDRVYRDLREDPATANVFSQLMESTG
ncbi:MAG: hypothetical protein ACJ75S_07085 [Solirubrobacterales bacterium]|jgi:hypothetical protein